MILKIEFLGYWHAGSGQGSGHHVDAICLRNQQGLPFFPGRQLKGLLRHALRRAEAWHLFKDVPVPVGPASSIETLLFGSVSQSLDRNLTFPGMLQVSNAELNQAEASFLAKPEQVNLREQLFAEIFQTAINSKTGTAVDHSLRGLEVCIPVSLFAEINLHQTAWDVDLIAQQRTWLSGCDPWLPIRQSLSLIDHAGAYRSRGLGEVKLSVGAN